MLPLQDAQVRLVLLNHVTVRLADAAQDELHAAGIEMEQLAHLRRQLSAVDLSRLAAMRSLTIGVTFDGAALRAGLRAVALSTRPRALETYFIRHGASTHLMSALQAPPQADAQAPPRHRCPASGRSGAAARLRDARAHLPGVAGHRRSVARVRYYRLHQGSSTSRSPCWRRSSASSRPTNERAHGEPRHHAAVVARGLRHSGELSSLPGADHRRRHLGIDALAGDLDQPGAGAFCRRLVPPLPGTVDTGDRALALGAGDRAPRVARSGLLEERRVGMPAKLWFRVRADAVWRALQAHAGRLTGERRRRHRRG